jgi:hypothetical protein
MPDLRWEDAASWLELDGSLLDGVIACTTISDWQAVIDLVRSVGWWYDFVQDGRSRRMPAHAADILADRHQSAITLHVRPVPTILVNLHFFGTDSIDFDFDPRELQSQEDLDVLCHVLRTLGRKLGKPVILSPEGMPGKPLAAYDPGSGRVTALA